MLEKQNIPVVLVGMDTKTDEKNTVTGQLVLAQNLYMQKTKKWRSRNGYAEFGTNALTTAKALAYDGSVLTAMTPTTTVSVGATSSSTNTPGSTIYTVDKFHAVSPYNHCEFMGSANNFVTFNTSGSIVNVYINGTLSYVTSTTTVFSSAVPQHHRVSNDNNSTVYQVSADGATVYAITPTAASSKTGVISGTTTLAKCAGMYVGGKSYVLVCYLKSGNVYGWIWNKTDNSTVSEFAIQTGFHAGTWEDASVLGACSDGKWHVAVGYDANTWNLYTVTTAGTVAAASPSTQDNDALFKTGLTILYNVTMSYSGVVYYSGATTGLTNERIACYIGSNILDNVIVSKASSTTDNAVMLSTTGAHLSSAYDYQSVWIGGFLQQGFNDGYSTGYPVSSIYISATEMAVFVVGENAGVLVYSTNSLPTVANHNGQNYTNAGGTVSLIGSSTNTIATAGYYSNPVSIVSVTATGSTGNLLAGLHQMFFAWKYIDSQGKSYFSPAGEVFQKTASANDYFTLKFYQSMVSRMPSERHDSTGLGNGFDLTLWCTEAGGSNFYLQNSSVSYGSNEDSEDIGKNRAIFTDAVWPFQGGILESGALPPCGAISSVLGRVWAPVAMSFDQWMYSTTLSPNWGPRFPTDFRFRDAGNHGRPQIAQEMDNKILLFHEYGIFVTWGIGPDETGAGQFSEAVLVSQSVGCKYPRSVVLTDAGVMFMSHEGIYLVTKGLQIAYIGKDVEQYNILVITGAINLTDKHQIWFTSTAGTTLVFDEFHKIWSIFTGMATNASMIVNSSPTFIRSTDGKVLQESASAYNDAGTTFSCAITSGWISLAGVQGFKRMYRFTWSGTAANTATLTLYRDWSAASFETFTIVSGISTQWQVRPKIQKCEAMQFTLEWANITGLVELSALGIEAGVKRGTFKLQPANRVQGN